MIRWTSKNLREQVAKIDPGSPGEEIKGISSQEAEKIALDFVSIPLRASVDDGGAIWNVVIFADPKPTSSVCVHYIPTDFATIDIDKATGKIVNNYCH